MAQLGTTPKHYGRIVRFRGTLLRLSQRTGTGLADIAAEHGYSAF